MTYQSSISANSFKSHIILKMEKNIKIYYFFHTWQVHSFFENTRQFWNFEKKIQKNTSNHTRKPYYFFSSEFLFYSLKLFFARAAAWKWWGINNKYIDVNWRENDPEIKLLYPNTTYNEQILNNVKIIYIYI